MADEALEEMEGPLVESSEDRLERKASGLGFPAVEQRAAKELVGSFDRRRVSGRGRGKDRAEEKRKRRLRRGELGGGCTAMDDGTTREMMRGVGHSFTPLLDPFK